jgi:urea transport system substrate-binding protein
MTNNSNIKLTIDINDPDLDPEEQDLQSQFGSIDLSIKRRQFLKWLGFGSVGLVVALMGKDVFNEKQSTPSDSFPLLVTGGGIKVGILHSLSGTMAISEKSLVDAEQLAIEEINKTGGVLGKQIIPIIEDGASDWPTFSEKAQKLIDQDKVATVFGCWTSASRRAVLEIFETKKHLLWYPVAYEGQECSQNVFYTGAVPNQQIEPSVDWLLKTYPGKSFFLVGSDYVFPRTVNSVIKAQLAAKGGKVVGEEYVPLGSTEVSSLIAKIKKALPQGGIIYNSLNGDTNVAFFIQLHAAGMSPDKYPSMSVNIAEEEVRAIGTKYLKGHFAAWNYFQTVDNPANRKFVAAFKAKYGESRVVNDPMEAAYTMVYLWKMAVEKAKTYKDLKKVRVAAVGLSFMAPNGRVVMNGNHHISKIVRIGKVRKDGLFEIVNSTSAPVFPLPWNQYIAATKGYACDWSNPKKGGKYKKSKR